MWITGEDWSYTHWDSGQPDNHSGEDDSVGPASLSAVDGCQIRYSKKSDMSGAKSVKIKKGAINPAKTVSNLEAKKKYYVQIRTYKILNGKSYYSEWSAKKSVKTKAKQ